MSTATATGPVAAPTEERSTATRAPADLAPGPEADRELELLGAVPRPDPDGESAVVPLRAVAGGLTARQAEWRVDGGTVLLTGEAPFVDLIGQAGVRADGSLDGTVAMEAAVRVLGLEVATAAWDVAGWSADVPLPSPAVQLQGTTLVVDLGPVGADVALEVAAGLASERTELGASIALPDGATAPGVPLEPRVVELLRTLHGWDVSELRAHPDAPVQDAPAFVSDTDLFFAPGRYGPDSPETAALLDAAIRAALAGLLGPVDPTPPAPPAEPAPDTGEAPAADTDPVPATVPETPPVGSAQGTSEAAEAVAAPGDGGAEAADGAGEAGLDGEAEAPAVEGEGEAPAVEVELIMPEAPSEPGPAAQARAGGVGGGARAAAQGARDLPSAEENVADARGAVTEPVAETAARAQEELAAALGERPAPSPEIVELCERIRTAIRRNRPVDENELVRSDPTREAQSAGHTIAGSVEGQVQEVEGGYDDLDSPPSGTPALTPTPVDSPDPSSPGMGVDAASAAPDPIPAENLSLDADVEATDERIADSGIDTRVTQEIPDGPFATVRDERGELGEMAQQTPAELAAEQQAAIDTAQADMAALQARATEALLAARAGTVTDVAGGQGEAVQDEEQTRESVSARAQTIFDTARTQVTGLLEPLSRTAMARWTAGLARASQEFTDALDRVEEYLTERYSGVGGFFVGIGDAVVGMPRWIIREYERAEEQFGDDVCDLLLEISTDVNGVIAAAQAIIAQARDDIDAAFDAMEAEFPEFAAQERARFAGMLDGLSQQVTEAQTSFVRDVSEAATTAVAEAQAAVEERRQAARGVLGRIVAAIEEFIDDPVTAIINGLLNVLGIPPGAFWALVARIQQVASDIADDPENFINNLTAGVKLGFEQFFDNFGTHVLTGFWNWLFSGLESPVPMPADFSPRALFSFALQIMGITWPRVREILVRHVGEQNVAIIEAAWELVSVLIEQGPEGIVEMVKEQLTPEVIVQTILEAAVEYLIETLIQQVVMRVIGMLNPAGAVLQALDLIYQVCSWIFRNAARIFRFVEAIVNGMADVIAGNIGGLANAVEGALASMIPVAIDFLAGLLHLGGLPNQVAEVILRLQARVYSVMDLIIGFLVERGRALLAALGIGGEEDEEENDGNDDDELGTTVRFAAAGESHRTWVEATATGATLMVASVTLPIESKIAHWRGRLDEIPGDERPSVVQKLNALASAVGVADTMADQLAPEFAAASADPAVDPPSDAELEGEQRSIAAMLNELFEIFEGRDRTEEWLTEMAQVLPPEGESRASTTVAEWRTRLVSFTVGNQPTSPRLWADSVLDGLEPPARAVVAERAEHEQLLPYLQSAPGDRSVDTGAFRSYVFTQTRPPHPVQRLFREAYGNAAVDRLKQHAEISSAPGGPGLHTRWQDKVRDIGFRWYAPGGGAISWPTGRVPDHELFAPVSPPTTREAGGVRTIEYDTVAGQHFTVTRDSTAGLTLTVEGKNLRFRAQRGRGVTEGDETFTEGNGFNRSHIIADEFSGSGWAVGGNIVTASAHYNQNVMREAEREIGRSITRWAQLHGRDKTTVSFDMTVNVTFGALRDPAALAEIKQASWFPAGDAGRDLDAEITAKLDAGHVHPDLMRITSVLYTWTFTDPAGESGTYPIGQADLWLLMSG